MILIICKLTHCPSYWCHLTVLKHVWSWVRDLLTAKEPDLQVLTEPNRLWQRPVKGLILHFWVGNYGLWKDRSHEGDPQTEDFICLVWIESEIHAWGESAMLNSKGKRFGHGQSGFQTPAYSRTRHPITSVWTTRSRRSTNLKTVRFDVCVCVLWRQADADDIFIERNKTKAVRQDWNETLDDDTRKVCKGNEQNLIRHRNIWTHWSDQETRNTPKLKIQDVNQSWSPNWEYLTSAEGS